MASLWKVQRTAMNYQTAAERRVQSASAAVDFAEATKSCRWRVSRRRDGAMLTSSDKEWFNHRLTTKNKFRFECLNVGIIFPFSSFGKLLSVFFNVWKELNILFMFHLCFIRDLFEL